MDLVSGSSFYYIKRSSIVATIEKNGRKFYSRFEKVNKKPDHNIVRQHLEKKITIGIPLIENGHGDTLFILYEGDEQRRFLAILSKFIDPVSDGNYSVFYGKTRKKLQIFIKTERKSLEELHEKAALLSNTLGNSISRAWKVLPDSRLPQSYNMFVVPYSIY